MLPQFKTSEEAQLLLRNSDHESFYFSIVDLQSNGSVNVIFPREGDVAKLGPSEEWTNRIRLRVPEHYKLIRDYLLVIATREPTKVYFLKMPAIARDVSRGLDPLQQLLSDASFGSREVEMINVDTSSWGTALLGCETHR
jgi:hypothetical protein